MKLRHFRCRSCHFRLEQYDILTSGKKNFSIQVPILEWKCFFLGALSVNACKVSKKHHTIFEIYYFSWFCTLHSINAQECLLSIFMMSCPFLTKEKLSIIFVCFRTKNSLLRNSTFACLPSADWLWSSFSCLCHWTNAQKNSVSARVTFRTIRKIHIWNS